MGNTGMVQRLREKEVEHREAKREELLAYAEGSQRRQSVLEREATLMDEAKKQQLLQEQQQQEAKFFENHPDLPGHGEAASGLPEDYAGAGGSGGGGGGPGVGNFAVGTAAAAAAFGSPNGGNRVLTDRDREAWLRRVQDEPMDGAINDNMELQSERLLERQRRESRRGELENLGADTGLGYFDRGDLGGDDPTQNREILYERGDIGRSEAAAAAAAHAGGFDEGHGGAGGWTDGGSDDGRRSPSPTLMGNDAGGGLGGYGASADQQEAAAFSSEEPESSDEDAFSESEVSEDDVVGFEEEGEDRRGDDGDLDQGGYEEEMGMQMG